MPAIDIQGCKVLVPEAFLQAPLSEQNAVIDKIASQLGIKAGEKVFCPSSYIVDLASWWLSLFGVHDPESTKLALVLVAAAVAVGVLYTLLVWLLMAVGAVLGAMFGK